MRLFSRRQDPAVPGPPVRRDKVMKILNLVMEEADSDPDDVSPDNPAARLSREERCATKEERLAAYEAAKRHGY